MYMEKRNNGLTIFLAIVVICLGGFILYDKNVFGLKGEMDSSIDSSTKKDESIVVGSLY